MSKKVFIGVGHGGTDSGAVKYFVEKEYTLITAFAVAEYLSEYGIDYKMSRTQDIDTEMNSKVAMCNKYNPDLVVDIHFNAGGGHGFEVYYSRVGGLVIMVMIILLLSGKQTLRQCFARAVSLTTRRMLNL